MKKLIIIIALIISGCSVHNYKGDWPGFTPMRYDVGFSIVGTPATSAIFPFQCTRTINFPANFASTNSQASCGTNPSETDTYTVKVAGSSIGTVALNSSCSPTFSTTSGNPQTCTAGQRLELDAPATVSGANIAITFAGSAAPTP